MFKGKLASHKVGKRGGGGVAVFGDRMGFRPAKPSLTSMLSVNFWLSS